MGHDLHVLLADTGHPFHITWSHRHYNTGAANFLQNATASLHDYTVSQPGRPQSEQHVTPYPTVIHSYAERKNVH
jgi:hypothetical protein